MGINNESAATNMPKGPKQPQVQSHLDFFFHSKQLNAEQELLAAPQPRPLSH